MKIGIETIYEDNEEKVEKRSKNHLAIAKALQVTSPICKKKKGGNYKYNILFFMNMQGFVSGAAVLDKLGSLILFKIFKGQCRRPLFIVGNK